MLYEAVNNDYRRAIEKWTTVNVYEPYIAHVKIENVIFNYPATIVFWSDGTKTVVKCDCCNEAFDDEKGLAMAISKKFLGNKGNYYNEFKKWLPKIEEAGDDNLSIKLPPGELSKIVCENIRNSNKNNISRKKHLTL